MVVAQINGCIHDRKGLIPDPSVQQYARFSAYLCHAGDPEQYLLILCCSPCHFIISEVGRDVVSSAYTVVLHGESTSDSPLNKADEASFHLPDTLTLIEEKNALLTYVLMYL